LCPILSSYYNYY